MNQTTPIPQLFDLPGVLGFLLLCRWRRDVVVVLGVARGHAANRGLEGDRSHIGPRNHGHRGLRFDVTERPWMFPEVHLVR